MNAGINVWTHASSTHNIGQFGQFYGIGAASAAIAIYGAPILGPATPYIAASFQASADDYVSNGDKLGMNMLLDGAIASVSVYASNIINNALPSGWDPLAKRIMSNMMATYGQNVFSNLVQDGREGHNPRLSDFSNLDILGDVLGAGAFTYLSNTAPFDGSTTTTTTTEGGDKAFNDAVTKDNNNLMQGNSNTNINTNTGVNNSNLPATYNPSTNLPAVIPKTNTLPAIPLKINKTGN